MIDKLLLEHVGLPHILVLAVHLVNFFGWMSQGGHSEQLLLFALFYQSTPSWLKVIGWGGWVVAHVIIVSAQVLLVLTLGLNFSFEQFILCSNALFLFFDKAFFGKNSVSVLIGLEIS